MGAVKRQTALDGLAAILGAAKAAGVNVNVDGVLGVAGQYFDAYVGIQNALGVFYHEPAYLR